jgi:hypothetical protein
VRLRSSFAHFELLIFVLFVITPNNQRREGPNKAQLTSDSTHDQQFSPARRDLGNVAEWSKESLC